MMAAMSIASASPAFAQVGLDGCWVYDAQSGNWLYACGNAALP
jgi:hypothetical protein